MRDRLVAPLAELIHERLGDAHALVGGHGDSHALRLLCGR
jgi:hypothetical protein